MGILNICNLWFLLRKIVLIRPGLTSTEVRLVKMNFNQINLKSLKMNKNMQNTRTLSKPSANSHKHDMIT